MGTVLEGRCGRERRRGGDGQRGAHRAQGLGLHPVLCWGGGAEGGAPSWSFGLPPTPLSPYLGTHFPHGLKWAFSECQGLENRPRSGEKAAPENTVNAPTGLSAGEITDARAQDPAHPGPAANEPSGLSLDPSAWP